MSKYDHVDDWLDDPNTTTAEYPAKLWLEKFRAPAHKKDRVWLDAHTLTCRHNGTLHRVVGCSRLGDVWLTSRLKDPDAGYERRVGISECFDWRMTMSADPHLADLAGKWRIIDEFRITGHHIPVILDDCNQALFAAHACKGVYERIVEDHNANLKPFVSDFEDEMDD